MKKVMVFGAFDGLHPGHLDFFKQAKKYGDFLICSIGTDTNVRKIKGKKPLFTHHERLNLVSLIKLIDKAVLGAEKDFYSHIMEHKPDVICLGYDQWADVVEVKRKLKGVGLINTEVVRLKPYLEKKAKSTIVKKNSVDY